MPPTPTPGAAARPSAPAPSPKPDRKPRPRHKPPAFHDNAHAVKGRLPDGSTFHARYLAGVKRWVGELIVEGARFEGDASGVFQLLHDLDNQYRAAKLTTPAAPVS